MWARNVVTHILTQKMYVPKRDIFSKDVCTQKRYFLKRRMYPKDVCTQKTYLPKRNMYPKYIILFTQKTNEPKKHLLKR